MEELKQSITDRLAEAVESASTICEIADESLGEAKDNLAKATSPDACESWLKEVRLREADAREKRMHFRAYEQALRWSREDREEPKIKIIHDKETGNHYCLRVWPGDTAREGIVEFYDTDYEFTEFGQPTGGSYLVTTLLDGDMDQGLDLQGSEPKWKVSGAAMKRVRVWLEDIIKTD